MSCEDTGPWWASCRIDSIDLMEEETGLHDVTLVDVIHLLANLQSGKSMRNSARPRRPRANGAKLVGLGERTLDLGALTHHSNHSTKRAGAPTLTTNSLVVNYLL